MKLLSCLLLLAVVAMSQGDKPYYDVNDAPSLFEKFIKDYNRHYKDEADKQAHYKAFVRSLGKKNKVNAGYPTVTLDIDEFTDYTHEELEYLFGWRLPGSQKG